MNTENKISINNLIYALLFLTLGMILLTSTEDLISIVSKVIGSIIVIIGIVKVLLYVYRKGKLGDYSIYDLIIGILFICIGVLLIAVSSTLSFAIRIIIGIWIVFAGINRIIFSISIKRFSNRDFIVYLITSLLMIALGVLIISGLFDQLVGLLIIIYSIMEIVDYIYYKVKCPNYDVGTELQEVHREKKKSKVKNKKGKVVDAVIEDEEESKTK